MKTGYCLNIISLASVPVYCCRKIVLSEYHHELSLVAHVTAVCHSSYNQLCQLRPVVHSLSVNAIKTLVQVFISCRLDYCNSLPYGISYRLICRLQSVQNAAGRLVTRVHYRDHITPVLRQLHRLRVVFKIQGLYISRSLERLSCTSPTTVSFFQTLVFVHCSLIPMICGSCSCREHVINLAIGVSQPPVINASAITVIHYWCKSRLMLVLLTDYSYTMHMRQIADEMHTLQSTLGLVFPLS